jgi:hypothetical protein
MAAAASPDAGSSVSTVTGVQCAALLESHGGSDGMGRSGSPQATLEANACPFVALAAVHPSAGARFIWQSR